jgi:general secretion pathway protein C
LAVASLIHTEAELAAGHGETNPLPEPSGQERSAAPIIARNPFDSVTGPLVRSPEAPERAAPVVDPLAAPECDGLHVHATTESSDPLWSMAVIQAQQEGHGTVRRVGHTVDGKQIVFIGFNPREASPAVWFESGEGICQSILFSDEARPGTAKRAAAKAKAKPKGAKRKAPKAKPRRKAIKLPKPLAAKIKRIGPGEFHVDRSAVDQILRDYSKFARSVKARPVIENGRTTAIGVHGIGKGTLLSALGLQNGDQIQSINGFPLTGPEKALQAYARLRTANTITVRVKRQGKPMAIDYRVR